VGTRNRLAGVIRERATELADQAGRGLAEQSLCGASFHGYRSSCANADRPILMPASGSLAFVVGIGERRRGIEPVNGRREVPRPRPASTSSRGGSDNAAALPRGTVDDHERRIPTRAYRPEAWDIRFSCRQSMPCVRHKGQPFAGGHKSVPSTVSSMLGRLHEHTL
jgi:hypothetical protein